jgi:hypothetical protein
VVRAGGITADAQGADQFVVFVMVEILRSHSRRLAEKQDPAENASERINGFPCV